MLPPMAAGKNRREGRFHEGAGAHLGWGRSLGLSSSLLSSSPARGGPQLSSRAFSRSRHPPAEGRTGNSAPYISLEEQSVFSLAASSGFEL